MQRLSVLRSSRYLSTAISRGVAGVAGGVYTVDAPQVPRLGVGVGVPYKFLMGFVKITGSIRRPWGPDPRLATSVSVSTLKTFLQNRNMKSLTASQYRQTLVHGMIIGYDSSMPYDGNRAASKNVNNRLLNHLVRN